jgi:hypothetical protein
MSKKISEDSYLNETDKKQTNKKSKFMRLLEKIAANYGNSVNTL